MKSKFSSLKQHRGALLSFFAVLIAVLILILTPTIWFRSSLTGFDWILVALALIVTILALAFYDIYAFLKKRRVNKQFSYPLWIYLAILISLLYLHTIDLLSPYECIQIIVTFTLVLITAVYAIQTTIIAKETREQRYSECLPLLVPEIPNIANATDNEDAYFRLQNGVDVIWRNHGKGVAVNAEFYFRYSSNSGMVSDSPYCILTTIGIEKHKGINFIEKWVKMWQRKSGVFHPQLEASYYDVYGRNIITVQELDIVKGDKRAFLGVLYFTINGKRLGEEVTPND